MMLRPLRRLRDRIDDRVCDWALSWQVEWPWSPPRWRQARPWETSCGIHCQPIDEHGSGSHCGKCHGMVRVEEKDTAP